MVASVTKHFFFRITGFAFNDPVRYNDSFKAFEEVLKLAVDENVDFILLAGDLFHFSKPTPDCLNRCLSLLRKYCVGQRRSTYELISKESDVFNHCNFQTANVTDPSLNIAMAIYSIHGNHDDPTGVQRVSALDLLSTCGLVNYFGKWSDLNKINIVPLLFQKKESRLAVYGKFLH